MQKKADANFGTVFFSTSSIFWWESKSLKRKWKVPDLMIRNIRKVLMQPTLRFLLYVLVLLYVLFDFFPDWINYKYWTISKNIHRTGFFYYYTTLPIIRTGWKISLYLQIYLLVDLKNMGWNIYKTSTYNRKSGRVVKKPVWWIFIEIIRYL